MYYLIDGYNLLYQTSCVSNQELIDEIDEFCQHLRRSAKIVFDGYSDDNLNTPNVEVIFGGNADEEILKMIDTTKTPSEVTLVSSDNEIVSAGRAKKIKVIKSEDFDFRIADKVDDDNQKNETHISDDDVTEMMEEFNHFRES